VSGGACLRPSDGEPVISMWLGRAGERLCADDEPWLNLIPVSSDGLSGSASGSDWLRGFVVV